MEDIFSTLVNRWPWFLLIALSLHFLYIRWRNPLNVYPGPFVASFTNAWRVWNTWSTKHGRSLEDLHQKYGNIVRLGPNVLSFSDPRAIRDIYGVQQNFFKSDHHKVSQATVKGIPQNTLFASLDQTWHANLRRAINPAFSMPSVINYEPCIDDTISIFLDTLQQRSENGELIDLTAWFEYFAWDVMGQITFGQRQGFVEAGKDIWTVIEPLRVKMEYSILVGQMPWLDKLFAKNPIRMWLDKHGYTKASNSAIPFALAHEAAHKARRESAAPTSTSSDSSKDLLDRFLDSQQVNPDIVTDREITSLGLGMLFAGGQTTAVTLTATLYFLMKNPACYAQLRKEITSLSSPSTYTATRKLPYLDACIKETLRLFLVVRFIPERVVPSPGATICGKFIPAGTIVGASPCVLHRNRACFGEDVNTYRPERWLSTEENVEQVKEMNRVLFAFGNGPHSCLGKNIALMEIYKVVPELLKRFEFGLEDPDAVLQNKFSSVMPGPLWVKLKLV